MMLNGRPLVVAWVLLGLFGGLRKNLQGADAFVPRPHAVQQQKQSYRRNHDDPLMSQTSSDTASSSAEAAENDKDDSIYQIPEDAVIRIRPNAMKRLQELRQQQDANELYLRMGVKSGGCSGMSYVMDFCQEADITEDDVVDAYDAAHVQCVVDPKSILYLYGLELDYSTELIGGGFKFFNPNAEESCGCGSSFGI